MKLLQIIKWSSLTLSIMSFSVFFFIGSFVNEGEGGADVFQEQDKSADSAREEDADQPTEPIEEELNYDETDCQGIINAFENQQDKKVENFPEGLLFNYQSCIKYGTPGNSNKEKEKVNEKSNNSQKDKPKK